MPDFSELEGKTFPSFSYTIDRNKAREFLLAIGDDNPAYFSDAEAVPLPPTFPTVVSFWGGFGITEVMSEIGVEMRQVLHGDQEYKYLNPIRIGDTISGSTRVKSVRARAGMDFIGMETTYTNQHGDEVVIEQATLIIRGDEA